MRRSHTCAGVAAKDIRVSTVTAATPFTDGVEPSTATSGSMVRATYYGPAPVERPGRTRRAAHHCNDHAPGGAAAASTRSECAAAARSRKDCAAAVDVDNLVRDASGDVRCTSAPGRGTTFELSLPAVTLP